MSSITNLRPGTRVELVRRGHLLIRGIDVGSRGTVLQTYKNDYSELVRVAWDYRPDEVYWVRTMAVEVLSPLDRMVEALAQER